MVVKSNDGILKLCSYSVKTNQSYTLATAHEMLSQRPEEPENHIHLQENVFENIHPKINFLIEYLKPSFKAIGPEEEI